MYEYYRDLFTFTYEYGSLWHLVKSQKIPFKYLELFSSELNFETYYLIYYLANIHQYTDIFVETYTNIHYLIDIVVLNKDNIKPIYTSIDQQNLFQMYNNWHSKDLRINSLLVKHHHPLIKNVKINKNLLFKEVLDFQLTDKSIFKYILYLKSIRHSTYWRDVAKDLHFEYSQKNNLFQHSLKNHYVLNGLFSQGNLISLSSSLDIFERLKLLSNLEIAYYLGFNIKHEIPSTLKLINSLDVARSNIDAHLRKIRLKNKNYINNIINEYGLLVGNGKNDKDEYIDTLYESIYDYNIIDIFYITNDSHIFFFTYPEFDGLISTQRIFNTSEVIHPHIIQHLKYLVEQNKIFSKLGDKRNLMDIFGVKMALTPR